MPTAATPHPSSVRFASRTGLSASLFVAVMGVLAVETVVLHLWLSANHPVLAWLLTALSLLSAAWLVGDRRAADNAHLLVSPDQLTVDIGWRVCGHIARHSIAEVGHATWRDIPDPGQSGYINTANPNAPNVLLRCAPEAELQLFGVVRRRVSLIGVQLDDPDGFVLLMKKAHT